MGIESNPVNVPLFQVRARVGIRAMDNIGATAMGIRTTVATATTATMETMTTATMETITMVPDMTTVRTSVWVHGPICVSCYILLGVFKIEIK